MTGGPHAAWTGRESPPCPSRCCCSCCRDAGPGRGMARVGLGVHGRERACLRGVPVRRAARRRAGLTGGPSPRRRPRRGPPPGSGPRGPSGSQQLGGNAGVLPLLGLRRLLRLSLYREPGGAQAERRVQQASPRGHRALPPPARRAGRVGRPEHGLAARSRRFCLARGCSSTDSPLLDSMRGARPPGKYRPARCRYPMTPQLCGPGRHPVVI
jgi:hypothetical protein